MRPESTNPRRHTGWKRWLDRIAVAWIVCAPLGVLTAAWLGLLPGTAEAGPRAEVPIEDLLPQSAEPSSLPAESTRPEPWRTALGHAFPRNRFLGHGLILPRRSYSAPRCPRISSRSRSA